jgi:hypothetical protein
MSSNFLINKENNENNVNSLKEDVKISEDINLNSDSTKESIIINEDNQEDIFKGNVEKEDCKKELNNEDIKDRKANENSIIEELNNNNSQNIIIEIKNNEKDDDNEDDKKCVDQKEDDIKEYNKKK